MLKEAKCARDHQLERERKEESLWNAAEEGQRGCEGVLPLLEGMKSLALSLQ